MSKHEELIKSLRASAAAMPFDAAVAVQYRAAADALEDQAREIEGLRKDAAIVEWLTSQQDVEWQSTAGVWGGCHGHELRSIASNAMRNQGASRG